MGKTHSKPLAARHVRGTAWARHSVCESAFKLQGNVTLSIRFMREAVGLTADTDAVARVRNPFLRWESNPVRPNTQPATEVTEAALAPDSKGIKTLKIWTGTECDRKVLLAFPTMEMYFAIHSLELLRYLLHSRYICYVAVTGVSDPWL
jgi:hypothetical protein